MAQRKEPPKTVSFRTNQRERVMIDRAASSLNLGPSEYAHYSTMKQVEIDLANETEFEISQSAMSSFMKALDQPAQSKRQLKKLLTEKSVLE